MENYIIPKQTHIGYVHLNVSDLNNLTDFYSKKIGFKIASENGNTVCLSSSGKEPYLFKLVEIKDFVRSPYNSTGLFHTAIKVPSRKELAQTLVRLGNNNVKFHGFSDHGVSEAMYLSDPDGNGIEIYYDKPVELWPHKAQEIEMYTRPLNINSLLGEIDKSALEINTFSPGTCIGHIHLKVSSLEKAKQFYCDILGFEITQSSYEGALFVSAGGYHHHIGLNVWYSSNGAPRRENSIGLESFGIMIPNSETVELIRERLSLSGIKMESNIEESLASFVVSDPDNIKVEITRTEN